MSMDRTVYNSQSWRALPRTECLVSVLLGDAAGECRGLIHRHHVDPTDPESRTVEVCAVHHARLQAEVRALSSHRWRSCPHRHTSREAREQCERRLNR